MRVLDAAETPRKLTMREREEQLLFSVAVAGKNSDNTLRCMSRFEEQLGNPSCYLSAISRLSDDELMEALVASRFGQYTKLHKAFRYIAENFKCWQLSTVSVEMLEAVPGIGPKTARFFVLHTQKNKRHAVLDTHILKWLTSLGYITIPKATPQKPEKYALIESYFLNEADKRGIEPARLDYAVWYAYKNGCVV